MPALDRPDLEGLIAAINDGEWKLADIKAPLLQSGSDEQVGVHHVIRPLPDQCSIRARFMEDIYPGGLETA